MVQSVVNFLWGTSGLKIDPPNVRRHFTSTDLSTTDTLGCVECFTGWKKHTRIIGSSSRGGRGKTELSTKDLQSSSGRDGRGSSTSKTLPTICEGSGA